MLLELANIADIGKGLPQHLRPWVEEQKECNTVQTVVQEGAVSSVQNK